jgi:N-acetylneuraminic acid mutarotase
MRILCFLVPMAGLLAACRSDGVVDPPPTQCPPVCDQDDEPETPEGSWAWAAGLPGPRREMPATAVGGAIYVAGGFTPASEILSSVVAYDTASGAWSMIPDMPGPRHHPGVVGVNGKLYVLGGYSSLGDQPWTPNGNLWEYDPETDEWTERAWLPRNMAAMAVAAYDGRIYVFGGTNGIASAFASTFVYDPLSDSWTAGADMILAVEHTAAATIGSEIYVVGGRWLNAAWSLPRLQIYSPASDDWREGPPMEQGRSGHAVAVMGDRLYAFGGERLGDTTIFDSVEEYDPVTNAWRTMAPMPHRNTGFGAVGFADRVHIVGGEAGSGSEHLIFRVP